jgi:chromosome segregation protein
MILRRRTIRHAVAGLIEQTLKPLNATVTIRFEVNGVPHVVRRSSADGAILLKISSDEMRPCTEDEVRSLLPIEAYSQKQLSDVSVRIDELSRFVTAPIRGELNRIDRDLADHAERMRQSYAARRRRHALEQTTQTRELEAKSLTEQANALRAGLTGLSEDDRALLERGRVFDAANQAVEGWKDGIRSLEQGVAGLQRTVDLARRQLVPAPTDPPSSALVEAHSEYISLLDEAKATHRRGKARQRAGRDQRSGSTGRTLAAAGVYARSVSSPWLHGVCITSILHSE